MLKLVGGGYYYIKDNTAGDTWLSKWRALPIWWSRIWTFWAFICDPCYCHINQVIFILTEVTIVNKTHQSFWITAILTAINPLTDKFFNLNFYPLEVVSRWRDPQLQVSENYSDLTKWRSTVFEYCWLMSHFICTMFKRWYMYLMCW